MGVPPHGLGSRITSSWRAVRQFVVGLPSFLNEMRGLPRRARYTLATRGFSALRSDISTELITRLRRGTLAAPPHFVRSGAIIAVAERFSNLEFRTIRLPQSAEPRASIVIPAFNEFASTYACLTSILEASGDVPYEVVISDDGSHDKTRDIESMVLGVRVVRSESNTGFIGACNRGAEAAHGEFLVFLNNDTIVTPCWIERLLEPFDDDAVGLVGAKLIYPDGRLQEAGGIIFSDGSGWNYGRGDDPEKPKYEYRCDADYCSGAGIAIPRGLFRELGGFDTRFAPMYYEDVDMAFAVRAAGRRVVYQPRCVIVHAEGGTAGTDSGRGVKRYQAVNQRIFVEKWRRSLDTQPEPNSNPDLTRHTGTNLHVLVIDLQTPRPDLDAGSVRMLNILRILRRLGCRVSFLPENRAHAGEYTRALQDAGIEAIYHPFVSSLGEHLKEFGGRYDAVIMSRVDVARQVIDAVLRYCPRARRIFDTVDLHFLREERRAEVTLSSDGSKARRIMKQELAVARACEVTLVVSSAEQELLAREAPDVSVDVLSLIERPEPTETLFSERCGILFIGSFRHPPNVDAVEHYLRRIHPRVRERLPDVPLIVIGADPPRSLVSIAGKGARFVGHVQNIGRYFSAARISVAPLRFGAGVKGKIVSSLAFGVPVVTTTIGAEGMHLEHREHTMIADGSEAFADAVVELYSNEALWRRIAESGLRLMTSQFSFEQAEATITQILGLRE